MEAEAVYRRAAALSAGWSVPQYNLGLLCKRQGRWRESLDFNRRASELDPSDEAAWWNLGIAATAIGDWAEARRAWAAYGMEVPPGEGAPDMGFGQVPVRLDPEGSGEVVWADRLDPARARLLSVPLPASGFRWGDLVLHDGAPNGYRMLHGRQLPVFDVLERLERSAFRTFVLELGTGEPEAVAALERIATAAGGAAENWGTSTTILCADCSRGLPHRHAEAERGAPAHPHCGVAARNTDHLRSMLDRWLETTPAADLVRWTEVEPAD
jgi:hypothetical protein